MAEKSVAFGPQSMRQIEKQVFLLQIIDTKWREHLITLEHLRSVVGFQGYAQRDPLNEYKNEAFQLFEGLLNGLRSDVSRHFSANSPADARRAGRDDAADDCATANGARSVSDV